MTYKPLYFSWKESLSSGSVEEFLVVPGQHRAPFRCCSRCRLQVARNRRRLKGLRLAALTTQTFSTEPYPHISL